MKISIQQPEFCPWLGFFDKMSRVDKVVFLDTVQFKKRYFENRNRVRTHDGWAWVTVPVKTKGKYTQRILDVEIDDASPWRRKITDTLHLNYKKAPFWKDAGGGICDILNGSHEKLVDLNLDIISYLAARFGIGTDTVRASDLDVEGSGADLIVQICEKLGASAYLSGVDGAQYLDEKAFAGKDIRLEYQSFKHPHYTQIHGEFMPQMSAVDLYFNHGEEGASIINNHQDSAAGGQI